jgi:VIT1/CCC1 family predicted Fe2+/Mn2+ transporter
MRSGSAMQDDANLAAATDEAQSGGIRAAVLGVNDGLVTNVSLILGVAGGTTDPGIVKLAGVASLVAGACSMAVGEWVSMQAQVDLLTRILASVRASFDNEEERIAAVKRAFCREGLSNEAADAAAADLGDDHEASVQIFARVILGINPSELGSPWIAAITSLVMFAIGALVPLIPWYLAAPETATLISIIGSVIAAFVIGSVLGYRTDRRWLRGGLRQVLVIVLAAGVTFGIGRLFHVNAS